MLESSTLRDHKVEILVVLAREIWRAHYPDIISAQQIEYMLAGCCKPALTPRVTTR